MSLLLLFGGGAPAVPVSHRHNLTLISSTRGVVAAAMTARPSLGSELGYGSAIPDSEWAIPDFLIPDDVDVTDWLRDEHDLTPVVATRASLGGERGYGSAIPDNSPWSVPDFLIPDDSDTTDWSRDENDLTPSPPTRATLTPT